MMVRELKEKERRSSQGRLNKFSSSESLADPVRSNYFQFIIKNCEAIRYTSKLPSVVGMNY